MTTTERLKLVKSTMELELLSPEASVRRRNTCGGTEFEQAALQIAEQECLAERRTALKRRKKRLKGSRL